MHQKHPVSLGRTSISRERNVRTCSNLCLLYSPLSLSIATTNQGGLGAYVKSQRQQHKRGKLSEEKVGLLNGLGMEWAPKFHVDYEIRIPPGALGLAFLRNEKTNGARITAVEQECGFADKVSVGDRIMTVDGRRVARGVELPAECNAERVLGIARRKERSPRRSGAAVKQEEDEEEEDGGMQPPPLEGAAAEEPLVQLPDAMEGVEKQEETEEV